MNGDSDDEEDDDDIAGIKMEDDDDNVKALLSPEDVKQSEEIAGGVGRIKLKRVHSADLSTLSGHSNRPSTGDGAADDAINTTNNAPLNNALSAIKNEAGAGFDGSPLKRAKASLYGDVEDPEEYQRLMASSTPGRLVNGIKQEESEPSFNAAAMPSQSSFWGSSASASSTQAQASQTALPDDDEEIL